jgi:ABC-type lipoprotein release transport system permease subunit
MSVVSQSLRYYWRHHLGFVFSVALACAVMVAGLMVGDSLEAALSLRTEQRLGPVDHRLALDGRWFESAFVDRLGQETSGSIAPMFSVSASAKSEDGQLAGAQLMAVDERLWAMGGQDVVLAPGEVILNASLASALGVAVGDAVIFRFESPDALPAESALRTEAALANMRLTVSAVHSGVWPVEMGLHSSDQSPFNAFVSLDELESRLGWRPLNTVLFDCECDLDEIDTAIERAWQYTDAQLELVEGPGWFELRSERVLLEPDVVDAAMAVDPSARKFSSWFVDEARGPSGRASYFFVTANEGGETPLSADLGPRDVAISDMLAQRLGIVVGDPLSMKFPVLGARKNVVVREADFTVQRLYDVGADGADASLMPSIPGMAGAESCTDWNVGLPIDLNRIDAADEAFWQAHGGAPKAIISMEAARALWSTPYGVLTSIRFSSDQELQRLERDLRRHLEPKRFGFFAEAVRERMTAASAPVNDFGQLFFGFNFFLIISSLFLMSVFSGFAIERRRDQQGLLVALGFTPARVRRTVLLEFGLVSAMGCLLGLLAAVVLTKLLLFGLMGAWQDAVGMLEFGVQISVPTLLTGAVLAWTVSVGAAWFGVRSTLAHSAWFNLRGSASVMAGKPADGVGHMRWMGWGLNGLALGIALFSTAARGPSAALVFFGCGGLVLAGCLVLVWSWIRSPDTGAPTSLMAVGVAGIRVRPKSSFAVVCVIALGLYLVGGVGGGTLQPRLDPSDPHSGTGGFSWLVQTSIPVQADLGTPGGLAAHGLDSFLQPDQVVGLGVFAGDDASCMNLGTAQIPRLLGVQPEAFIRRDVFQFLEPFGTTWRVLLAGADEPDIVPVVGDAATVYWGLHLRVGDELEMVDEHGQPFRIRIAAVVDNWLFQGSLVADRAQLARRFPSRQGDSAFLLTTGSGESIDARLADHGVVVQPSVTVLEGYRTVERTFMLIFGVLGGLGVLLAVLGVVAVFYRRSVDAGRDRALLEALGFTPSHARRLGLGEMTLLMAVGLVCGVVATVVSLMPRLLLMEWTSMARFLLLACAVFVVGGVGVCVVSLFTAHHRRVESIHRNQ